MTSNSYFVTARRIGDAHHTVLAAHEYLNEAWGDASVIAAFMSRFYVLEIRRRVSYHATPNPVVAGDLLPTGRSTLVWDQWSRLPYRWLAGDCKPLPAPRE